MTIAGLLDEAVLCHRAGRFGEAEALYLGAGRLAGDFSAVALPLGALYLQTGQIDRAAETLEALVERQEGSAEGWIFLGLARVHAGRDAAAAHAYLRALALRPRDSGVETAFWAAVGRSGGLDKAGAEADAAGLTPKFHDLYSAVMGPAPEVTHPIFTQYPPWKGFVPPGFHATPYGSLMRLSFYGPSFLATGLEVTNDSRQGLPPFRGEEYFEWIDLLESIAAAKERFTMVELGAGFGRWIVSATAVIRLHRDIPFYLVGVEAEDRHFEMMRRHFLDNGLNPDEHRLIKAAVAEKSGSTYFIAGDSEDWWGQAIVPKDAKFVDHPDAETIAVPCLSIEAILESIELVDLIDMDVQGAEADAVRGSREALCAKVKRIHIGTHSTAIEWDLARLFSGMGWVCANNFPCGRTVQTHYGPISFGDGVQTWINPLLQNR